MSFNQEYQQTPLYQPQQTSTLATISLISGILTWVIVPIIGAIVAIITGHKAKNEIRDSNGQLSGDGMATAGLVLGYLQLVLGVIPVCIIIILVMLGPAIGDVFTDILNQI